MSPEDEGRALLLEQYERTIREAAKRIHNFRRELSGAVNTAERDYLGSRIAVFQGLIDETRARAETIRQALGRSGPLA